MTFEAAADRLMHEINEEIDALRAELIRVEDFAYSEMRSKAIRRRIRDLIFERDLLPRQRQP